MGSTSTGTSTGTGTGTGTSAGTGTRCGSSSIILPFHITTTTTTPVVQRFACCAVARHLDQACQEFAHVGVVHLRPAHMPAATATAAPRP